MNGNGISILWILTGPAEVNKEALMEAIVKHMMRSTSKIRMQKFGDIPSFLGQSDAITVANLHDVHNRMVSTPCITVPVFVLDDNHSAPGKVMAHILKSTSPDTGIRMRKTLEEMVMKRQFTHHLLIGERLEEVVNQFMSILTREHSRIERLQIWKSSAS